jgi:voltage-gated potassium channel
MARFKGSGHLMICGWSPKGFEIIRELRAKEVEDRREIVILADLGTAPMENKATFFVRGNPSNADDLQRAGIERVSTVIVLADHSNSSDDPDDLDARTLLTTLAVESLNQQAYSCVEVVKSENRQHFERTQADELVVSAELTGSLLAAAAITHGLTAVVGDLLTHPDGEEFYRVSVPGPLVGSTAREALIALKDHWNSTLVGIFVDGRCRVNPPSDQIITLDDELLVVRNRPAHTTN